MGNVLIPHFKKFHINLSAMAIFRFIPALILAFFASLVLLSPYLDFLNDEVEMEPAHLMKQVPLPEKLVPHMKLITHDLDHNIIVIELDCKPSQLQLHDELSAKGWAQDTNKSKQYKHVTEDKKGTKILRIKEEYQSIQINSYYDFSTGGSN